jgi:hypothetical protein
MTITAYAKHRGVSRRAVYLALREGRITREADGSLDPERCDRDWQANSHPFAGGRRDRPRPVAPALAAVRLRREKAKAELAELSLQKLQGELVDRATAERVVFAYVRGIRNAWQTWPSRISAKLAAETGADAGKLHRALEREVRAHLEALSEERFSLDGEA